MNENILNLKKSVVEEITAKFDAAQSVVVVDYQGLSVGAFESLRSELRAEGVDIKVYKNTLSQIAAEKLGFGELKNDLVGPNAIAFSNDDAVAGARILAKFAKQNDALKIKTGVVEGKVVSHETIIELSQLPTRDGLLSMLLSCLQAPVRDMAMIVDALALKVEETGVATGAEVIGLETKEEVSESAE